MPDQTDKPIAEGQDAVGGTDDNGHMKPSGGKAKRTRKAPKSVPADKVAMAVGPAQAGSLEARFDELDAPEGEPHEEADSLEQRMSAVHDALLQHLGWTGGDDADWRKYPWIRATYEDAVVYEQGDECYRLAYTIENGEVTFSGDPEPVKMQWVPVGESAPAAAPAAAPVTPQPQPKRESGARKVAAVREAAGRLKEAKASEGVLHVTVIQPGWSLNGRYYPAETLKNAAPMLEGARAFGDHAVESDRPERSIWDQIGTYKNVTVMEDGSIEADLKLVGSAEKKEHILDWAKEAIDQGSDVMGISIVSLCYAEEGEAEGKKGEIITEIVAFESADVVTRPAAGGAFRSVEASASLTDSLLERMPYEQWRDSRPDFATRLRKEVQTVRRDETIERAQRELTEAQSALAAARAEVAARTKERDTAQRELAEARAELGRLNRAQAASEALETARVPFVHRASLKEQLLALPDASWPAFLETAKSLVAAREAREPAPVIGGGPVPAGPQTQASEAKYDLPIAQDGEDFNAWNRRRREARAQR